METVSWGVENLKVLGLISVVNGGVINDRIRTYWDARWYRTVQIICRRGNRLVSNVMIMSLLICMIG